MVMIEKLGVPFETRTWKISAALAAAGHTVSVICPRKVPGEKSYEFRDGVHIYRHPMPRERSSVLGYFLEYFCSTFWETLYAAFVFLRRGFGYIHACNPPDHLFLIALPYKLFGVKYVFDQHDVCPELYLAKFNRRDLFYKSQMMLEKMAYRFADVVLSTNESFRSLATGRGRCDPEDVFVVRNGPELDKFKLLPPQQAHKHGKPFLVGYVGNMSEQDGVDTIIEVARYLRDAGRTDIHFTCIGDGISLPGLLKMVEEQGLSDCVTFTGRLIGQPLIEILSTADVCIVPDNICPMNDICTMIKIVEYMALSKPIVQFDLKEGRYSAGEASLYVSEAGGVAEFAGKIAWLLDHPEERQRMGEFGRRRMEAELSWEYSVQQLMKAYDKVFAK